MNTLFPSQRSVASLVPLRGLLALICAVFVHSSLFASNTQPTPVFPANNAVLKCPNASITLLWNEVPGTSTYFIDVCSDAAMKNHLLQKVVQFDTLLSITVGTKAANFYWTVSTGIETTPVAHFSSVFVSKVVSTTLYHNAELASDVVHFAWNADDAAGSYTFSYRVGEGSATDKIVSGTSVDVVMPREQTIIWQVRSICKTAMGEWSDPDTLRIAKLISDVRSDMECAALQCSPQPASSVLNIRCAATLIDSQTSVQLSDLLGRTTSVVPTWTADGCMIQTSGLKPGVYVVSLERGSTVARGLISIE